MHSLEVRISAAKFLALTIAALGLVLVAAGNALATLPLVSTTPPPIGVAGASPPAIPVSTSSAPSVPAATPPVPAASCL